LVEEVLGQTAAVGDALVASFKDLRNRRAGLRDQLTQAKQLVTDASLPYPTPPTTCAADGSYAVERLLSIDLAAAAAVAVEGLTPPSEKRFWEQPRHSTYIVAEPHCAETATVLRAVMLGRELLLAQRAPHDLVMLDMTFTLPIIYLNQALNQAPRSLELQCSHEFLLHYSEYLEAYRDLLRATRSDKHYVALPKYSTRREISGKLNWPGNQDDRGLLSQLLEAGELSRPIRLEQPDQQWHFNLGKLKDESKSQTEALTTEIVSLLENICVVNYKPQPWLPALRIEMGVSVATNEHRLATVVHGIKQQCATAGMLEPYPIYLADRTVKALARALPTFRQVATQRVSNQYDGDVGDVFFAMHGYRSESGG
jgi:hypothetical protein